MEEITQTAAMEEITIRPVAGARSMVARFRDSSCLPVGIGRKPFALIYAVSSYPHYRMLYIGKIIQ